MLWPLVSVVRRQVATDMDWEVISMVADVVGATAVVVSLIYLAQQVRTSNRLARAEAYRSPNSDLNATFSTDRAFRKAFRRALEGATREDMDPDERTVLDGYLISVTNIYEQLSRETREGIIESGSDRFGARGLFALPYYRTSWSFYKLNLSVDFVNEFEGSKLMLAEAS